MSNVKVKVLKGRDAHFYWLDHLLEATIKFFIQSKVDGIIKKQNETLH